MPSQDDRASSADELLALAADRLKRAARTDATLPPLVSGLFNRHEVSRLSRESKTVSEIATMLGISYGYVIELRMELGLTRPRKRR